MTTNLAHDTLDFEINKNETGDKSPRKQITFRKDEVQKKLTSYDINSLDLNLHKTPSSSSELEAEEEGRFLI
jgi:hypothetical protein